MSHRDVDVHVSQKSDTKNIKNDIYDGDENNFEVDQIVEETSYSFC
ncbi:hypothetical protein KKA50_00190 [Patescibacteria group bacterium]|nr:hypothetical protein [Patescibacteria group bacterium]